jgi:predicted transcriptional regulator of viral defense system
MPANTYRRRARELAMGQYGYFTTDEARDLGIPVVELAKLSAREQVRHVAYGLYRFDDVPVTEYDQYFEAVARVGKDAFLTGDSVLALHDLALVNPRRRRIGTTRRVRAKLPDWIDVVREEVDPDSLTTYFMIPSVTVAHAIRSCQGKVMTERLLQAVDDALAEGLVSESEGHALRRELRRAA